jgi:hypothetical protein
VKDEKKLKNTGTISSGRKPAPVQIPAAGQPE